MIDTVTIKIYNSRKYIKTVLIKWKVYIASLIGNVEDTFESEINHWLKLTDKSKEVLFHLSLGSTYLPNNYDELKWDLDLKRQKLKPEG